MECDWRILYREEKRSNLERKDTANVECGLEVGRTAETGETVSAREDKRSWNKNV